ncbi:hypothetical protein [Streptomyces sp. URMC 123]|uniref:hypothetical protein n=1 Tax=Streptomyces sp. URMC 123 TaxID=3423403 RepID=UPI003F1A0335
MTTTAPRALPKDRTIASAATAMFLLTACTSDRPERPTETQRVPFWDDKATPDSVSKQLHVDIPTSATDRRAAYEHGFQDDQLLLAFVVPHADVDPFVAGLHPQRELQQRDDALPPSAVSITPFSQIGLEEPDALPNVRETQVCAPCGGDLNALSIAVHRLDDTSSRVYLWGVD